jgi:RND superfamily putative drug exporter
VLLVWLVIGGPLGSFAAQLSSVQENDNAAFLPQSAESTRALEKLVDFADEETIPAVVVAEREGGLAPGDLDALSELSEEVQQLPGIAPDGVRGPLPSADGEAAQLVVTLDARDGEEIVESVLAVRDVVEQDGAVPDGLTVLVGGQGGVLGDFIDAFGAIDGLLLGVALLVVLVILLVVYRSPILPLVVITSALLALGVASAAVYGLAVNDVLDVNGQSQGILFILAIGAATDYSLLLVARYREELREHESPYDAMRAALRGSWEPITASGLTVVLGLLCLLLADLTTLAGLGPVGALGILAAMLAALTLLPAALVLLGRRAFWPFRPEYGSEHRDATSLWGRLARLIDRRARIVAATTALVLAALAGFAVTLNEEQVPQTEVFLTEVDSVRAQEVLDAHFEADDASPVQVVVPEAELGEALAFLNEADGVARGTPQAPTVFAVPESVADPLTPRIVDGEAAIFATLDDPADSAAASETIRELRTSLRVLDPDILVGGASALAVDSRDTTQRDRAVVIPAILLVVLLVLIVLLRSLVAPVVLLVANVLSFGATLGVSALVFNHLLDYPGTDAATTLIGFVFLVALGIDYSIFLMTRVREESLRQGTRPGILKGLAVTGGVITSAGIVLAATFVALGVVPILFLAQIAFIVAFGVLLDALVVRSLLVPAVCHVLGPRIWWPSKLSRETDHPDAETAELLRRG